MDNKSIQTEWIKLLAALLSLVTAIVVSSQQDPGINTAVRILLITAPLTASIVVFVHLAFSRSPSQFGGKGAYRFSERYRTAAFIGLGFTFGVIVVLLVVEQSRAYIVTAFAGDSTPTPTIMPVATATSVAGNTATITSTPTVMITDTATATETSSPTPTLTPTPTPSILFQDQFLNNSNQWVLQPYSSSGAYESKIIGGKFIHNLNCSYNGCTATIEVPNVLAKNFQFDFDVAITRLNSDSSATIGIGFRELDPQNQYIAYFESSGASKITYVANGREELLKEWETTQLNTELGAVNKYRIVATGYQFEFYANGILLTTMEDGNLPDAGKISVRIIVFSRNNGPDTTVELDNFVLQEIP